MQGWKVSTSSSGAGVTYLAKKRSREGDGFSRYMRIFGPCLHAIHRNPIDDAESLVRCSPGDDATNGFFVSMFIRRTYFPEDIDHNDATKRKHADDSPQNDHDEHQKKPRKRKKASIKAK